MARFDKVPEELKELKAWVCWQYVPNPSKPEKPKKMPINPLTGNGASSADPTTWTDFKTAVEQLEKRHLNGLGFMFGDFGYVGIDIDNCVKDGKLTDIAQEVYDTFNSYTEVSPSGKGMHIIVRGTLPTGGNKNDALGLEMYSTKRYFTVTGIALENHETIYSCQNEIEIIHSKHIKKAGKAQANTENTDSLKSEIPTLAHNGNGVSQNHPENVVVQNDNKTIIELASKSKQGDKFMQLYNGNWKGYYESQSQADQGFCNMLAFWTRCDDQQMDSIFRESGLIRDKWDEMHGVATYGSVTITKAIDGCTNMYEPRRQSSKSGEQVDSNPDQYSFEIDSESGKIKLKDLDYAKFAMYLIEKYHIVKIENVLHYYSDGLYVYLSDDEFDGIIMSEVYNSKINNRKEFHKYVKHYAESKTPSSHRYILFNNGVYDLEESKLLPVSTDFVFCNRIPHNYNENATTSELFDKFLFDLVRGDSEGITLLKQVIGYTFCRQNFLQEFFFILGNGGNGKSTFLNFMDYLIGKDNTSYLTLEDMKDNFNLPLLKNKLLNIGDDIENEYIERVGSLKKIITGETITAGGKYKDKEPMKFYGKVLFSGNTIPPMNDKTNGMKRRLNVLPFLNNFKDNPDIELPAKLAQEDVAEYAIKIGIEHLQAVIKAKKFIKPDIVKIATAEYNRKNNHVIEFIEEHENIIEQKETQTIYDTFYDTFCKKSGYRKLGRYEFYQRMKEQGYEKIRIQTLTDRPYMFKKLGS